MSTTRPPSLKEDLCGYHERLLTELQELAAGLESADIALQIEVGSVLRDAGDAFAGVLDGIKERVREHAVRQSGGRVGTLLITGSEVGQATVNIPEASLRMARGRSIDELRRALGEDFDLFFEETLSLQPRKDFEARVAAMQDTAHRHLLLTAVERIEGTPRVGFKRLDSNKLERSDRT